MIKVSDLAAKAISASSRTFLSRFLHNGTEISGDVRSVITYKGSCGESAFTPGAVYSSYIDVVIDNCQESLSGKELTYQIGVVIDENTTEWYDIGKYTVHKPSTNVYTTSFTALGRISAKLGMMYQSKLTFPATIKNILNEISQNTGISIDASAFDTTGVIEKEINGYMYREVLAIIAGIFFAYVTEDTAGNIVFANYKNANVIATDGDRTSVLPTFADADTEITGVRVVGGEIIVKDPETGDDVYQDQTFISGNANVAIQNEFMTQALFEANAGNVIGFTYRPATVSISLGDFRIEPFDSLQVTDSLGVVRTVPCMSIIHRFDGGIMTDIVAPELQDTDDSGTAFKGMMSQAVQRFQQELISVKTLLAGTVMADELKATYATIESLNAANANIQKLQTDKLDASVADLKYATISNLNATVAQIDTLKATALTAESAVIKSLQTDKLDAAAADLKYATILNLEAATASIEKLQTDKLDATSADLKYATINNLNAAVGRISSLETNSLTVDSAVIKALQTDKLDVSSADLKYATISSLNATNANITKLQVDKLNASDAELVYATIENLNATNANITKLQTDKLDAASADLKYATITNLNAAVGRISKLETDSLTTESAVIKSLQTDKLDASAADLKYATISNLDAATASINKLQAEKLDASSADLKYATITNLNAAVGRISTLETNSLTAESAVIKILQSDIANIDTLIFGSATGTVIQTSFSNAVIARLGNAQIKSAMIDSLSADKITSGSINTNNVSIQSADGSMVIADNTIQIKDGGTVRVQIGKDASGNYSIVICDTSGNVMFNTNGITADAIKSAIIRDAMVASNANISASKLNIDSLFTEINNSTKTIKSTKIFMDDIGQTLDIAYTTAVEAMNSLGSTVSTQGTQISAIQGQITSKIWQQDINTVKNSLDESIDTLSTNYSTLNQTVSGLNSTVASHTSQIAQKADSSAVTTVNNKLTSLEQNLNGFRTTVSSTYATKETVNKTVKEVHRYYCAGGSEIVVLEEMTFTADNNGTYMSLQLVGLIGGVTYTITFDGVQYTFTAERRTDNDIDIIILGDIDNPNPFIFAELPNEGYIIAAPTGTHTISISTSIMEVMPETKPISIGNGQYTVTNKLNLQAGATYTVVWKGTPYQCVAFEAAFFGTTGIGIGNFGALSGGNSTGEPFVLGEETGTGAVVIIPLDGSTDSNLVLSIFGYATKPTTYPPSGMWSKAEPTSGAVASTLCTIYVDGTFSYSDISVNTAGEIAANAKDEAQNAQTQVTQLSTRVTQTESSITSQASSISSLGTRMSTVEQTANGITISLQQTNSNVTAAQNAATAAQQAANKAQGEVDTLEQNVEKTYQKTVSKGEQLITNGNGLMGDNTNFSAWTFDGAIANNSSGSFTRAVGSAGTYTTDEYFPVNPTNEYTFSLDAKSAKGVGKLYSMLMFYDADKQQISAGNHIHNAASTTTLARDLKAGDTTIYLTSAAGWSTTFSYGFYMIVWNYKNSFGYTYPACTYSRTRLTLPKNGNYLNSANLNKTANTITLETAYSGPTIPAGTSVSQGGDGATYKYFPCSNTTIPTSWTSYSGKISGVDYSGQNKANIFPPGTAYAKLGFLWNYQGSGNGEQQWITNLSVSDTTAASNAQATANSAATAAANAQTTANTANTNATNAQTAASNAQSTANTANSTANTAKTNAATAQSTADTAKANAATAQTTANNAATAASSAQSTANTARTEAANAAKTATNFLSYDATNGLLIGNKTSGSWSGSRAQILPTAYNILSNTGAILASFGADKVYIGKNSRAATIDLLNGLGTIKAEGDNADDSTTFDRLYLQAPNLYLKGTYASLDTSTQYANTSQSFSNSAYANVNAQSYQGSSSNWASAGVRAVHQNTGNEASVNASAYSGVGDTGVMLSALSSSNTNQVWITPTQTIFAKKYIVLGDGTATTQANVPYIKWATINSKVPYFGYASDQTDGTFVWSINGTNYASGLAIGGGSGNLLYKGNVVLTASNYTSYAAAANHTHSQYAAANHTHSYLPLSGGTITGGSGDTPLYVRSASTGSYIGIQNSSGSTLGYFGFSAANTPVVYIGSAKKILHEGNYSSYAAPTAHASTATTYGIGTSSNYGHVKLSDSTSSTSAASAGIAASPAAVKAAYDKGNHSHPYLPTAGGTVTGATTFSQNVTFSKNIETQVAQVYALEIKHATPFIDFHFGNSTADYTTRIIENSKGALTVSGTISQTSDRRLKENIMPLGIPQLMPADGGAIETDIHSELFDRLKPVQYRFINGNGKICYGLIAQDVVMAMHEVGIEENSLDLVHHNFWTEKTGKEKEQYSVSYNSLIALLIYEVQKLKTEIKHLKGEQLC